MAKWGKCDFRQLERLQKRLEKGSQHERQRFYEACAKELAARLLAKVIKRTPVGKYNKPVKFTTKDGKQVAFTPKTGMTGGTLRRGWTAKTEQEAQAGGGKGFMSQNQALAYAESLEIKKSGNMYQVEIINPVHYASYVEYGHRTANHKGWVEGKFMLTISEQELDTQAPAILERKIGAFLGECFND